MISAIFSGTSTVLPWGSTLRLEWNPSGTGANALESGAENIVYSEAIPCDAGHQVGILLFPSGTGAGGITVPVVARIQWSVDRQNFVEEKVERPGAIVDGAHRFGALIKEWGPHTAPWPIWRPVTAIYFRLGIYATDEPDSGDLVKAFVLIQKSEQLQSSPT